MVGCHHETQDGITTLSETGVTQDLNEFGVPRLIARGDGQAAGRRPGPDVSEARERR
jgi:hypothetical protein